MSSPLEGGLSGGDCPHLAPPCSPQLHIVHINVKYRTLAEAKGHPNGLAVLGFFFQVGLWGLTLPVGGGTPPTPPPPGNRLLAVRPGEHCTAAPREREGAGRLGQGQEGLGNLSAEKYHNPPHRFCARGCRLGVHPSPPLLCGNVGPRLALPADARPCSMIQLGPAPAPYFPLLQVSETPNANYNTIVAGLRNVSQAGESSPRGGRGRKGRDPGAGGQGRAPAG